MIVAAFREAQVWDFHAVLCATAIEASWTGARFDERLKAERLQWTPRLKPNLVAIADFQWTDQKTEWRPRIRQILID